MVETAENLPQTEGDVVAGDTPAIDVKVEDIGPARKRLTVTLPADRVRGAVEDAFATLGAQSAIPGFRPGKAPQALLERRFGKALRSETRGQLIATAYSEALQKESLKPVGDPVIDEADREGELDPSSDLTFSLEIEVVPTFELPSVENLPIRRPVIEVADVHIDAEIKRNCFRLGTPERITGPFEPLDRTLCVATVTKRDHEGVFFQTDQAIVVVPTDEDEGRGQLLGLIVEGVREALEGKSVGDTVIVETVGPAQHEREDVRGAHLTIELRITDAERIHPLTVDSLIARFGLADEQDLREQVRLALESRRDAEQKNAMREQLYEHLTNAVDFPLPEELTAAQVTRIIERQRIELLSSGAEADVVEQQLAQLRAGTESDSRARLKLFFIMSAFADKMDIGVTEGEINGLIAGMARQRGERPDKLRTDLQSTGRISEVALQIREHKTADRLLDQCSVQDIDAAEYNREVLARRTTGKPAAPKRRRRGGDDETAETSDTAES